MYTIEVDYRTGNSFNTEEVVGRRIGLCWHDKELARAALRTIQEHYKLLQERDECSSWRPGRSRDQIFKEVKKKSWYRPNTKDSWSCKEDGWPYQCKVKMDDGEYRSLPTSMWCGYFETLHEARVVCDEDDQDKVTF